MVRTRWKVSPVWGHYRRLLTSLRFVVLSSANAKFKDEKATCFVYHRNTSASRYSHENRSVHSLFFVVHSSWFLGFKPLIAFSSESFLSIWDWIASCHTPLCETTWIWVDKKTMMKWAIDGFGMEKILFHNRMWFRCYKFWIWNKIKSGIFMGFCALI